MDTKCSCCGKTFIDIEGHNRNRKMKRLVIDYRFKGMSIKEAVMKLKGIYYGNL